jgi:glycosyltransferase involved in cell wall biosynthesis
VLGGFMLLIDSVYINDGGGAILLKYLIDTLEKSNLKVFYLLDNRSSTDFSYLHNSKVQFLSNSNIERIKFYKENGSKFSKVLCFGNVPPPVSLKVPVYVYLHQKLFLEIPSEFSFKKKLIYTIKQIVLYFYKDNTNMWLVQSELMKAGLEKKYLKNKNDSVKVLPFYPPLHFDNHTVERVENSFLYVSNSAPHKNHENLINAFCDAFDQIKVGSLVVTVPQSDVSLCALINSMVIQGYPINNVGFVDRESLIRLYLSHEYLIFPSLAESFGLGLAEAIDGGCKVIAADLPYTYQVCSPSLTFDPYTKESMKSAIITAVTENLPSSKKIISNDIKQLILLLSE